MTKATIKFDKRKLESLKFTGKGKFYYAENFEGLAIYVGRKKKTYYAHWSVPVVRKDGFVGFASKDGSTLKGNNINFSNVNIPFSSYIKKSEYDKAILEVNGVHYQNYLIPYLKDQYSLIEINNDNKTNINKEVLEIIYNKNIAALQKN